MDGLPVDPGPPKQRAVLALLLVHLNRVVPVDTLIDQLWGDEAPPRALGSLQAYVSNLRRLLEPERAPRDPPRILATRAPGYVLNAEPESLDTVRFERLAALGHADLEAGRLAEGLAALDEALALWRGVPLADFAFELFTGLERSRVDEVRAGVDEDRAQLLIELGKHQTAVTELGRLTTAAPFRERRWELLMLALYRCGRQAAALEAFQSARQALTEELGLEPGTRLQELERAILQHDPGLELPVAEPGRLRAHAPVVPLPAPLAEAGVGPSNLVGRQEERSALEGIIEHGGTVVTISGEAGIGKTTLVQDLAHRAAARGIAVAWGRCVEIEGSPPLWPWLSVMESLDVPLPRDAAAPTARDGAHPDGSVLISDYAQTERSSFELFSDLAHVIVEKGRSRPCLVLLEDLHWADSSSLGLLRVFCEELRGTQMRVVVTFREGDGSSELSDALAALARVTGHRRILLSGLSPRDVMDLAAATVGTDIAEDVARRLCDRTAGNPFFLTELIKLLASEGRLRDGDVEGPVPAIVGDVIRSRLARLPEDTQALLTVASVCGQDFDFDVVRAVAGLDEEVALDLVEGAIVTGLVKEPPLGEGRCEFCHALVRETLYRGVSGLRRARLHRRVAEAIEVLDAQHPEARVDELAFHYWSAVPAGTVEQAFSYSCRAAERAGSTSAHAEAAVHWEHALAVFDRVGSAPHLSRYALLVRLGQAERLAALAARSREHLREAAELAEAEGDVTRAADAAIAGGSASVWNWTGTYVGDLAYIGLLERLEPRLVDQPHLRALVLASLAGEHANRVGDRVAKAAAKALEIAEEIGDPEARFAALNASYVALQGSPDLGRRLQLADALVDAAGGLPPDRGVVSHLWRFLARLQAGDGDAAQDLTAAEWCAAASRQPALKTFVELNRALLALHTGPMTLAESVIEEAVASFGLGHEWDGYTAQVFLLNWMKGELAGLADVAGEFVLHQAPGIREAGAMALASAGRTDEARIALSAGEPPRVPVLIRDYTYCVALCARAEAVALIGDAELAASCLQELSPFSGQLAVINAAVCMGAVDFYLARLASTMGDGDAAVDWFLRAVELDEGSGGRPFATLARFRLGEQLLRQGDAHGAEIQRGAGGDARELGMSLVPH
jgi:DNA-binding SARP family transcriptional activator